MKVYAGGHSIQADTIYIYRRKDERLIPVPASKKAKTASEALVHGLLGKLGLYIVNLILPSQAVFFCSKPIIGAINGFAMGGGAEMVVNLDLAVAGESATLGFPEAKRGVTVGAGGIPRLVRLVGHTRGRLVPDSLRHCSVS